MINTIDPDGKRILSNSDNILSNSYSFYSPYGAIETYAQPEIALSCKWPTTASDKIRLLKSKQGNGPLAITSMRMEKRSKKVKDVQSAYFGFGSREVMVDATDVVLVIETTLESSPTITCEISDGSDYVNEQDKAMWVHPYDLEDFFKKNGLLVEISEDSGLESIN